MTTLTDLTTATDLDTLCRTLNRFADEAQRAARESEDQSGLHALEGAVVDLPRWGAEPDDTSNIWSWDATRIMRQNLSGDGRFYLSPRGVPALAGRGHPIHIRLTAEERAEWETAARAEGETLSAWLRRAARALLRKREAKADK